VVGHLFAQRYEIRGLVGRGGMGAVYRALDRELDEEVALKVLETAGEGTPGEQQLRREIKLARTITHPNVVRAYDFGESEGVRFFTMEYVAGATLRELLDEEGRLAPDSLQIEAGMPRLGAVHRAGIVHGDLKPANVVVMTGGVAKLTDFGVARAPAEATPFAGTPPYAGPERCGERRWTTRSDHYSAGIVMYEMFRAAALSTRAILRGAAPAPRGSAAQPAGPCSRPCRAAADAIVACLSKARRTVRPTRPTSTRS
jgi:serine/threonine-protein kinase